MPYYTNPTGPPTEEELDLTNSHLHSLESVDIKDCVTYLDLTANRLKGIDPRILALKGLKLLCFRQNLLQSVEAINDCSCKEALTELIFHDNHLTEIPKLTGFAALQKLEFSYNEIRSVEPLASLQDSPLQQLYCASNKITSTSGLQDLEHLEVLELGMNRISELENLSKMSNLQELWLGRNRIACIRNLSPLTNLAKLALTTNRLESMEGVEELVGLEELYLSFNGIHRIQGLAKLTRLRTLDLAQNRIEAIEGLDTLHNLQDLWLNDNAVATLDGIADALSAFAGGLRSLYLENNPAAAEPDYSAKLLALLPQLEQLDSNLVEDRPQHEAAGCA